MRDKRLRYLIPVLLLPLVSAGIYLSIRADLKQARTTEARTGGPPIYRRPPVVRPTLKQEHAPHDLTPVPNPNPNAPPQPFRYHPVRVATTPDGSKAYITLHGAEIAPASEVAVVDLEKGKLLKRIRVGSRPKGLCLHPGGRFLVVLNWFSNYASVIDTRTDVTVSRFAVPYYCQQLVFNRAGSVGYVTNFAKDQVLVLDVRTRGDQFEARMRKTGGFSKAAFLGYHDLAEFDRRFADKLAEKSSHEGQQLARCSRCNWADWYRFADSFQCQYCGVSQAFKGRVIEERVVSALSTQKVSELLSGLPLGINAVLRARCGTAGCHSQPAGGFIASYDVEKNFQAAVANCVPGDGEGSHLLRMCVSTAHGGWADSISGTFHPKGGVIFDNPEEDPDYQAIRRWIDDASEGPGIAVGRKPDALALSEDEKTLYVASPFEQSISVVDLEGQRETRRIYTQSVVTDLQVKGNWLVATSLGSGFGAPKQHDPDGRESLNRENPRADFSLWRDPDSGKPLPISHQKALGPFAHVDGTEQEKFRDISNDLIIINLAEEAKAGPRNGPGWGLDVSRYRASSSYTRYTADTFEAMFGDKKGDIAPALMKVIGAHPEEIDVWEDTLFVVNAGSFEVAEYTLNLDADRPEDRLIPVTSYETDLHPRGLSVVPGGRSVLTANFLGETVSVIDRRTRRRVDIAVGNVDPRFPATDAERGELFVETSILSADRDQSCVHCHYRDTGDGRSWSVSQTMGTNRDQTEERTGGSHKLPSCVRNLFVQVPFFVEGILSIDEPLTMMMEHNPLIDFAGPIAGDDYTGVFCPQEEEHRYAKSADTVITAAPLGGKKLPAGVRLIDLAYRREQHFRRTTGKYWGEEYGFRDMQKFIGDFQAAEPRLLPNPNAQGNPDDPETKLGRKLFFNPEVGCASCHPSPHFTLKDGIYNQNASLPPLVTPNPRDDAHMLISADRQDYNMKFVRYWDRKDRGRIEENEGFFTTPSLQGVWAVPAVFLHHGQARSLREVICPPDHPALRRYRFPPRQVTHSRQWEKGLNETFGLPDTHGQTSHLSFSQINALVKFLKSIE
jgi:DNA-binding beta-propeller fold protein YncE